MGFTAELVDRALALRTNDVPEAALRVAKVALLDTIAVALAGRDERVVRAVEGFVLDDGGDGGACTIWGSARRAGAARAALVNGTAAHALDFDDVCWAMNAHPSAVLWPATLAVAELTGASGAAALLGYVASFEASAELGGVLGKDHYAAGWHPTATIGTIGATIAAGKILELDAGTLRRAIGIACSGAAGSRMNFGTDTKPLHAGLAAQAGVGAALLASRGVTAREDGIEAAMGLAALYGGDVAASLPAAGKPRHTLALLDPGLEVKPYPSCRFTHRVIDAVLALAARRGSRAVQSLECEVDPFAERIVIYPRPTTGQEAKFSMQYCAAVAWLDGWPGLDAFTDARAARSDVQELLRRVDVRPMSCDDELQGEHVTVRYADGGTDTERVRVAKGSPSRPLTESERLAKTEACARPVLRDRTAALIESLDAIETVSDVRVLRDVLATQP